jgi:hypothetical protein
MFVKKLNMGSYYAGRNPLYYFFPLICIYKNSSLGWIMIQIMNLNPPFFYLRVPQALIRSLQFGVVRAVL